MNKASISLFILRSLLLGVVCIATQSLLAQKLICEGEKDAKSVSIKMKDGVPSARVIVESKLLLTYKSNMNDLNSATIQRGSSHGINADTLYFFVNPSDNKRRITITATGYPSVVLPFTFSPKETYRYIVFDAATQGSSLSSIEQGDPNAYYDMAVKYERGEGNFPKDIEQAILWYEKAARAGHKEAITTLATLYDKQVDPDPDEQEIERMNREILNLLGGDVSSSTTASSTPSTPVVSQPVATPYYNVSIGDTKEDGIVFYVNADQSGYKLFKVLNNWGGRNYSAASAQCGALGNGWRMVNKSDIQQIVSRFRNKIGSSVWLSDGAVYEMSSGSIRNNVAKHSALLVVAVKEI